MEARTVSRDFIEQALRQGLKTGLITRHAIRTQTGHQHAVAIVQEYVEGLDA